MMPRLMGKRDGDAGKCESAVTSQAAIQANVSSLAQNKGLCIDRAGFPIEVVGHGREPFLKAGQQGLGAATRPRRVRTPLIFQVWRRLDDHSAMLSAGWAIA